MCTSNYWLIGYLAHVSRFSDGSFILLSLEFRVPYKQFAHLCNGFKITNLQVSHLIVRLDITDSLLESGFNLAHFLLIFGYDALESLFQCAQLISEALALGGRLPSSMSLTNLSTTMSTSGWITEKIARFSFQSIARSVRHCIGMKVELQFA